MLNEKLSLYLLFSLFSLLLAGQLVAQLYTVNQLNKVSGKVIAKEIEKTGYTGGKYSKQQYSLVLTLDDHQFETQPYNVDLDGSNQNIDDEIAVNDFVTVYCPTTLYNILSLDCLDFVNRVNQVEKNGRVLSSFRHRQNGLWKFTLCLAIAVSLFGYKIYQLRLDEKEQQELADA